MQNPTSIPGMHLMNRRRFLGQTVSGLSGIALSSLLANSGLLAADLSADSGPIRPVLRPENPMAAREPHYPPKAKKVVMIFCSGALSQVDSFDFKPELIKRNGEPMPGADRVLTSQGGQGNLTASPWKFKPRGQSGKYISDMLPNIAGHVDDISFIHSMTGKASAHGPGENFMSTGFTLDGFPSAGAWVSYALGSANEELPAFVAIPDPRGVPQMGPNNWGSGFLPAVCQGTAFNASTPIRHLARPASVSATADSATRDFLKKLNDKHLAQTPGDSELAARIASYELAAKMQMSVPEVTDLSAESPATRALYGADDVNPLKAAFARNCMLARRLSERGVRFVQLFNGSYAMGEGVGNWDGHKTLEKQYNIHAPILDQPVAALLTDMRARGLLDDTLVVFTTEFGRMPTFQKGASGRDHNPDGFTVWMTGAGVKRGYSHGATDDFGYKAVQDVATVYDFHATILHLLGLNHRRLSFYNNGTERRLTDVHGNVIQQILA